MEYKYQIFLVSNSGDSCPESLITFIWECDVTTGTLDWGPEFTLWKIGQFGG